MEYCTDALPGVAFVGKERCRLMNGFFILTFFRLLRFMADHPEKPRL
jgi:hypothetical protein